MEITLLKSKIHRATVTDARKDYIGSITIGAELMRASGIVEYEKVLVANVDNGERLETYVIKGKKGEICLNGAAAHAVKKGEKVIIMAFASMSEKEAAEHRPTVVFVDEENEISRIDAYEAPGTIYKK